MSQVTTSLHRIALAAVAALAICAALLPAPAQAQQDRPNAYPITNVNLRAGPGTFYPVIVVVPTHAPISILGCIGDYTWCDVLFQGNRGWMRSIYLKKWYQGYYYALGDYAPRLGISVVSFDIGPYWDSNYRERPFYRDRGRWGGSYGEGWTDRGVFYDRLAPHGNWIWMQGQYVWVPANVGPHWRPYTVGRWVYTDRYGWMWSSREPFGWATYHYGRWGFSNRVGWFWVPGNRWAPAWVSWRQSDNYLAWAPLPPTADEGLGLTIRVGTIPDYYWQAVPTQAFLSVDLSQNIVRDRSRFAPILRETRPLGNVTVVNNTTIVNNVVNINTVEQKTEEKVIVHEVERTRDAKRAGKVEGAAVEIFQPVAEEAPKVVAPPSAKPIEEVAAASETKEQAEGAATTEEALVPAEIKALPAATQGSSSADTPKDGDPAPGTAETPPPPPPPADAAPASEEAAPPPPPPPAESTPPPPPAETPIPPPPVKEDAEPAPLPPPAPVEEAMPPSPTAEEPAPQVKPQQPKKEQQPQGERAKPSQAPASPPPPPQSLEEAAPPPPPPPAEEVAPPPPAPVEEVVPPPPPAEEPAPQVKPQQPKKEQQPKGERAKPSQAPASPPPPPQSLEEAAPPPPPPPAEEVAPPPPAPVEEAVPPPPPAEEPAPQVKQQQRKKEQQPKKEQDVAPPPATAAPQGMQDGKKQDGKKQEGMKQDGKKGRGPQQGEPCPEGMMPIEDGSCAPIQ